MKKNAKKHIKNTVLTVLIMAASFGISLLLQGALDISEHITTLFAFAVFLISLVTDGFWYGTAATVASVIAINYAFTYPYFDMDFTVPENIFSALVMLIISFLTSMLTAKQKVWQALKAEKMFSGTVKSISKYG